MKKKSKSKFHESEKKIFLCVAQGVEVDRSNFFFFFGNFFLHVKKLFNFRDVVNIKVAKFKLDYLGFYCEYSLF
jgi:hypothetical protein